MAAEELERAASGLPGCWHRCPLLLSFKNLRINLPPRQHGCKTHGFLQQINLPPHLHHPPVPISCRWVGTVPRRAIAALTQACGVHKLLQIERCCQSLRPQGNRFLPPNLIMTRGQSNSRGKATRLVSVPAPCTHTLPFSPALGPAEGKAGETQGEEEAGEGRRSVRLRGWRERRAGRVPRPSPGAVPLARLRLAHAAASL